MDLYAVFGNPVSHSLSPRIHTMFAEQTGQQLSYERREVPRDGFAAAVASFADEGGHGLNVTVPFKEEAFGIAGQRSERAERAGAVNTLILGETIYGDNTDGEGLVHDLRHNLGVGLGGKRILILGAGGAVRGVLEPLLAEQPATVLVANRTRERAEAVAKTFADLGRISACGLDELEGERFEVVINATSSGLRGKLPPLPDSLVANGATAYDMVYGDRTTPFVAWARDHGARITADGLGMLVEQAAAAFELWRRVRPDTEPVIEALRRDLQP
ncbi:shikimate dehydrogenase [Sediminicurvatus halobius]|uniref:Shikimate dehydrogenase (NADP(+)) n=1 Tax=Sediminicurvatus halobius TaxID=2182432 RepID=A0A2U2N6L3_9GAMM|nr:shikimate dehydrogenase [Spiribacter halobius]PWG64825.1 shikimate dehydrogenase [Spiribacter halobius]UEX78320.1 shikimate dehydrogenase [Spiribacter halobius]